MLICKNCRKLYEPDLTLFDIQATPSMSDGFLCSYHPGELEFVYTGARTNWHDVYRWTCCQKHVFSAERAGHDVAPPRSPGCKTSAHVADEDVVLDRAIASEIAEVVRRLKTMEDSELLPNSVPGVFISYSHADTDFVDHLTTRLSADRVEYWRDVRDLLVGEAIDKSISMGIQRHSLFLIVLSPASVSSRWVERELDEASHEAVDHQKVILPVLTGGLAPQDAPARVRRIKCANFNEHFDSAYRELSLAIAAHLRRFTQGDA
ncbi:MAG: TIR domain-containing protein [Planctomycetes bacterium]|nr:TIR domain-containing protein [Planctomycetota bacterium]